MADEDLKKIKAAYYASARRESPDDEAPPSSWDALPIQYRMLLIDMWHAGRRDGAKG